MMSVTICNQPGYLVLKVAAYQVGVVNQGELNTSPCMLTSDFAGRRMKNTEGELENDIWKLCMYIV